MPHPLRFPAMFALITFSVGLNLRPILAAVGPLLPTLQHRLGITGTEFSLLTSLPVAMMGLAALCGPVLLNKLGGRRGIALGLTILAVACLSRSMTESVAWLLATALIGGAGIGIIQALMPALIKKNHAQVAGTLMSLFSTGIMAGAALAAASAEPLNTRLGLNWTLTAGSIVVLLALGGWVTHIKAEAVTSSNVASGTLTTSRTWLLMLFFGIGTAAYTLVLAWLPPLYIHAGWSARSSGYLLAWLTLTEVLAGFVVSAVIHHFPDRRKLLLLVLSLLLGGLLCLILAPGTTPVISTLLLGLSIGALFPLSLIVTLDQAKTPAEAGALLSRVQGGGYLIAALMPLIAGIVRDRAASLTSAWVTMSAGVLLLMLMVLALKPIKAAVK